MCLHKKAILLITYLSALYITIRALLSIYRSNLDFDVNIRTGCRLNSTFHVLKKVYATLRWLLVVLETFSIKRGRMLEIQIRQ